MIGGFGGGLIPGALGGSGAAPTHSSGGLDFGGTGGRRAGGATTSCGFLYPDRAHPPHLIIVDCGSAALTPQTLHSPEPSGSARWPGGSLRAVAFPFLSSGGFGFPLGLDGAFGCSTGKFDRNSLDDLLVLAEAAAQGCALFPLGGGYDRAEAKSAS
jgi:hypothetical protein